MADAKPILDAIVTSVEGITVANSDPRNNRSLLIHDASPELQALRPDELYAVFSGYETNACDPNVDGVDKDGYTDKNIKEAASLLFSKLADYWGRGIAMTIYRTIPKRMYLNGFHSSSNELTMVSDSRIDDFTAHATRLGNLGVSAAVIAKLRTATATYFPFLMITIVFNALQGKVSKKMFQRIFVPQVHRLNRDRLPGNVFKLSLEKFSIANTMASEDFLYFGADMHPNMRMEDKVLYRTMQKALFEASRAAAGRVVEFRRMAV